MRLPLLVAVFFACAVLKAQKPVDLIVLDGKYFNGAEFISFKEIVIDSGRIVRVSDKLSQDIGRQTINAKGKYLIPGLTDAHVHLQGSPGMGNAAVKYSFNSHSALRAGVTTQMDLFSSAYSDMCKMADKFPQYFGSVMNAGPCITVPGGHGANMGSPAQITSVEEAGKWAKKIATDPATDFIKIIYQRHTSKHAMSREAMLKIVEVAHQYGKKVLAHIDHSQEAIECALAGVDVLAHIPLNKMRDGEVDTLKSTGVVVIPTYTVYEASYEGLGLEYSSDSLLKASAHPAHLKGLYGKQIKPDSKKEYWPFEMDFSYNLKKLIEKGVPIMAGTDAGNYAAFYGYALHHELWQYVQHGMTPQQALYTATCMIDAVFPGKKTGKITEGYTADMVILNANPLEDITNTKSIGTVINRGVVMEEMRME